MNAGKLKNVKGIIWDLDNTLYPSNERMEFSFNEAIARAAVASGVTMTYEEALESAQDSWARHGYSGYVFVREHGLCSKDLHFKFHEFLDEKAIEKCEETLRHFAALDVRHIILTHSHRSWAQRVLDHMGLRQWFQDHHVFGLEDYDFRHKHESTTPFDRALAQLELPPEQVVMVEDLLPNLRIPRDMGMMTTYIARGRTREGLPGYVQMVYDDTPSFLADLSRAQGVS